MKNPKKEIMNSSALRRAAEERFKEDNVASGWPKKEEDILKLIYELEVHQLELKLQNDQLQWAQEELDRKAEKYFDLYEFAPVGYFTLDYTGVITDVNLAGAGLLGVERSRVKGRPFQRLFTSEAVSEFNKLLEKVIASGDKHACDLPLRQEGARQSFVRIELKVSKLREECWAGVIDVTESRRVTDESSER